MAPPLAFSRPLRFTLAAAVIIPLASGVLNMGCGPDQTAIWVCFDPGTGHLGTYYDANHYVNGVFDPCHCYDPCGPADTCSILVDAGPPSGAGCMHDGGGTGGGDGG
jgi:hypothetical protein